MSAFLPYGRQTIEDDDIEAVVRVLKSDFLTTGPEVDAFESALADAVGASWAVAVSHGTAALHAACSALGVGEGDEVLVPAITFLATANCARYLGAEPVFVDVDPDTGLMDAADAMRKQTDKTRLVIPVHLTGAVAEIPDLDGIAVLQDAAHALGAATPPGAAVWSFHPVKHVCTGEGGAITGEDPEQEKHLRRFRNHGMVKDELLSPSPGPWYYEQQLLGHNLRMTDMQAALGRSQLGKLSRFLRRRRALAARYDRLFDGVDHVKIVPSDAYHLYVVLIDFAGLGRTRADLMAYLSKHRIGSQVHYIPLPMQPYYRTRGADPSAFPGALAWYERALSLPLFPGMDDRDVDRVAHHVMSWVES